MPRPRVASQPSHLSPTRIKPYYRIGTSTSVPPPSRYESYYATQETHELYPRPYRPPTPHPSMRTYQQAQAYLGPRLAKKLPGVSTYLERRQLGAIAVKYHATDVVTYYPNGDV